MTSKNSVYTVTPPDLTLNSIGPCVLLLGITHETSEPFAELYDKLFPEVEVTFFVSETEFDPQFAPWYRAVIGMASTIYINIDIASPEELFLAMQAERDNHQMVFWMTGNKSQPTLVSLLNSYQYQIFTSIDSVETFIMNEYGKTT